MSVRDYVVCVAAAWATALSNALASYCRFDELYPTYEGYSYWFPRGKLFLSPVALPCCLPVRCACLAYTWRRRRV